MYTGTSQNGNNVNHTKQAITRQNNITNKIIKMRNQLSKSAPRSLSDYGRKVCKIQINISSDKLLTW